MSEVSIFYIELTNNDNINQAIRKIRGKHRARSIKKLRNLW
jgi:hypothetical protein